MAAWNAFLLGLILLSLLVFAAVADDDNLWIYPTEPGPSNNFVANPAFALGSIQTIEWTTTLSSYYIALFQQQIDLESGIQIETIHTFEGGGSGDQSFKWTVQTYGANRTKSHIYFFWINPGSSTGFTSHYFNITKEVETASAAASSSATTSSTTSQSTTSTPSSTSSAAISTFVASARPTTAATPVTVSSTVAFGKSTTSDFPDASIVKVALGVGLGVGIPLVLFTGIWIGLKAVRQRRAASRNGDHPDGWDDAMHPQPGAGWQREPLSAGGVDQKGTPVVEAPDSDTSWLAHGTVHEAPGDLPPHVELDSGRRRWT